MTDPIETSIKNFELYKDRIREYAKNNALSVSENIYEITAVDLSYADFSDPTYNICYFLDIIERTDRVIEFLKNEEIKQ